MDSSDQSLHDIYTTNSQEWCEKYVKLMGDKEKRENELIQALESLENDVKNLTAEVQQLKQDNEMLTIQLQIVKNEKELHIEEHASSSSKWQKEKRKLIKKYDEDKKQLKKIIQQIQLDYEKSQKNLDEVYNKNKFREQTWKNKLEIREEELYKVIADKDKTIMKLKEALKQYEEKPDNKGLSNTIIKKIAKKKLKIKRPKSFANLDAPLSTRHTKRDSSSNDISDLITNIEKEQDELRQKLYDFRDSSYANYLEAEIQKNEDRLRNIKISRNSPSRLRVMDL
ncbi:unnamed protein product [Blepharisma stoltei]|uniref:Uncharacterized protein n=1 Tax=Blepharisma stoltei TaxID=1481888 RepID=A0AAU9JHG5_9CILI|nr:unnamed protein product [Blepharisma stoltei]